MKLFEYAVVLQPTAKEKKDGKRADVIVPVTTVVANDEAEVRTIAALAIPDEHKSKTDRIEVAVRPFR